MKHNPTRAAPGRFRKAVWFVKGIAGWATADRDLEAEARAELEANAPKPSAADIDRAEREVRHDYGELKAPVNDDDR